MKGTLPRYACQSHAGHAIVEERGSVEKGMRNNTLRRSKSGEPADAWENDRVGAGMQRWRREFPEIDCSGKAVVGRLLHLHEVFLKSVNRTLARHRLKYPAYAIMATLR